MLYQSFIVLYKALSLRQPIPVEKYRYQYRDCSLPGYICSHASRIFHCSVLRANIKHVCTSPTFGENNVCSVRMIQEWTQTIVVI